jgi:hypothetical protein
MGGGDFGQMQGQMGQMGQMGHMDMGQMGQTPPGYAPPPVLLG